MGRQLARKRYKEIYIYIFLQLDIMIFRFIDIQAEKQIDGKIDKKRIIKLVMQTCR